MTKEELKHISELLEKHKKPLSMNFEAEEIVKKVAFNDGISQAIILLELIQKGEIRGS